MPVADYAKKDATLLRTVEQSQSISKKNKALFYRYRKHLLLQDFSPAHVAKILMHLKVMMEFVDFDMEKASKEQLEGVVAWVQSRDLADATKRMYRLILKMMYKWLNGGEYPEHVRWISTSLKKSKGKKPTMMLTEDDVIKLLSVCDNPRDRALVSLLWETGARIGELFDLKIRDFEDTKHGLKVVIKGKTGSRRVPLISSVPYIKTWVNAHPTGENPESYLWVNIGTTNHGGKSEYRTLVKALENIGMRSKLGKPMNPHHFRHSRATYLATRFTEAQMNEWFGWVQGSDIPGQYVHLSGRDIDSAYARLNGIEDDENPVKAKLAPAKCPRCKVSVAPEARFCYQCGMAMKLEDAMKIEESQQKLVSAMAELDDADMNEVLKFTAKMFKLIKDDPELAERIGKGK